MSVVTRHTRRRWLTVAGGLAVVCALPAIVSALPVSAGGEVSPARLRARILASADLPYQGYAQSDGALGVPGLRELSDVVALLDGTTRMRVWHATASAWRVDVLSDAVEHDTYELPGRTYTWDSGSELLAEVTGDQPIRLPRPADFVPPALAVRLLRDAGNTGPVTSLPAARIAGFDAAGLRLVPADPATTIGRIDIWADPGNGLPLRVDIAGRGSGHALLNSRFLQISLERPEGGVLTPSLGPGTGFTTLSPRGIARALGNLDDEQLPGSLAGRARVPPPAAFREIGVYGRGLSSFAVITLRGHMGRRDYASALSGGATAIRFPKGTGAQIATPLITVELVHPCASSDTFIIAGMVSPQLLAKAGAQLAAKPDRDL